MWLRCELQNLLVDLGELDQAQAVLFKRLVILVELGHVEGELIVIGFDLARGSQIASEGQCRCFLHYDC